MPPRAPSADISLVYLPYSHRPHITKGTAAQHLSSHPSQPLTLLVFCGSLVAAVAIAAAEVPLFARMQIVEDCQIKQQEVEFYLVAKLGKNRPHQLFKAWKQLPTFGGERREVRLLISKRYSPQGEGRF